MNPSTNYDVIIIGAGPSGIFCAYELIQKKPDMKILMVEKGRPIEKRVCPKRTTKVCVGCKPCSITTGFAGAGAFSDGKLSLSPDVGGNLPEILGYDKTVELLKESDNIYLKADFETLYQRISADKDNQRPLFLNNSKEELAAIFQERQAWYEEVASRILDVTKLSPDEIIEELR